MDPMMGFSWPEDGADEPDTCFYFKQGLVLKYYTDDVETHRFEFSLQTPNGKKVDDEQLSITIVDGRPEIYARRNDVDLEGPYAGLCLQDMLPYFPHLTNSIRRMHPSHRLIHLRDALLSVLQQYVPM